MRLQRHGPPCNTNAGQPSNYFLLLVILLRNFILPMIILLAIPVAAAGGIGGLAILNLSVKGNHLIC